MRILQVIHDYLPRHAAGSEIYTANLSGALAAAGHAVSVFTCEEQRSLPQWSLTERTWNGLPVDEAIYNRIYSDLSEQWDDPRMGAVFAEVLDRRRPQLVHVQGLQFVGGLSALRAAAARRLPLLMTLHDYWLLCPRAGLMYDPDGRACETATPVDCARCTDIYPIDRARWSDARHGGEAGDAGNVTEAERVAAAAAGRPLPAPGGRFAELGDRRWFARALLGRQADLAQAMDLVGRFIAPSRFLAERFVAAGLPRHKLVQADYGFPPVNHEAVDAARAARRAARTAGAPLHAGFVGTLSDYKGALVFARAVQQLVAEARRAGRPAPLVATLHGQLEWFPDVARQLRECAAQCDGALRLPGAFASEARAAVLAELDLLVVPSLWWENSPLTIHEAWQHGLPVLASDRGGMAELLACGAGALFPPGDAAALAALLLRAAQVPEQTAAWSAAIPPVRSLDQDVRLIETLAREQGVAG